MPPGWRSPPRLGAEAPVDLTELLRSQRDACRALGSELYGRLIDRTLDRVEQPGPIRELLQPHARDPFGSAIALRFLGAVHRLVLEGRVPDLARHYPSVGGRVGADVEDAFEAAVAAELDALTASIEAGVQTNEVGRSAALIGALLDVARGGMPLRVFEIGSSGGLNLRWDHYRYEARGQGFGPRDAPVRFVEPWVDRTPRLAVGVDVIERRGCDRAPVDAGSEAGRLLLRSFVWPDLLDRLDRLDRAIEVAAQVPAPVDHEDAPAWTHRQLAVAAPGTATVVMHSIVLQYLDRESRSALLHTITQAGARASIDAPLAWIRMEPGREGAEVRVTSWPGGIDRLLAVSAYHGPPVRWLA